MAIPPRSIEDQRSKIVIRTGVRSNARTTVYQNGRTKVEHFRATRRARCRTDV
jgi:hypothetical protein